MNNLAIKRNAAQVDLREVARLIDSAGGNFAFAVDCFGQMCALFESIAATVPEHSLAHRLAKLGGDLCEDREGIFERHRDEYIRHVERYVSEIRRADASTSAADLGRLTQEVERELAQGDRHAK